MNLYEIDANIQAIIENGFAVDEDGVITFDESDLDGLQEKLETKLENIALYIKNLEADVIAFKDEEKALEGRRKAKENKADRLKAYLQGYLEQTEKGKFETPRVLAKITKGEAVEVDLNKLPKEYVTVKEEIKPDKTAIKQALKSGKVIEGCRLVQSKNVKIS